MCFLRHFQGSILQKNQDCEYWDIDLTSSNSITLFRGQTKLCGQPKYVFFVYHRVLITTDLDTRIEVSYIHATFECLCHVNVS